jgi:hypothetical protein
VKVNDIESSFFLNGKGLREGDPLSPGLFNFVVDVFSMYHFFFHHYDDVLNINMKPHPIFLFKHSHDQSSTTGSSQF